MRDSIQFFAGGTMWGAWVTCILLAGCFSGRMPPPPPPLTLHWDPPSAVTAAGDVTVAIVDAQMGRDQLGTYGDAAYFSSFAQSLDTDTQRLLIAKGLRVTGPFHSFDGMTFPEKKAADLAFVPRIHLEIAESYPVNIDQPAALGGQLIRRRGHISARGFVELTLVEPLSEQKMWMKKVELTPVSDDVEVDLLMDANGTLNPFHSNKDNRDTALIMLLNASYPPILDALWRYLDFREGRLPRQGGQGRAPAQELLTQAGGVRRTCS